ncbi:ArsR/SmtB family transcription factor [Lachnobacterium bovis]|uniref:DNA-binding transcriptional regulator, ArsR family n=1 Tax=Lachnobacterium bovis TaxID=140626 RepID=A0A1H9SQZ3_9FIRM|nr:metalloregulator ArsR/SmtB family transcription factor [Lachnobacterium bovis]SER87235.1 DNA-binding transcriptional regulator, ArsR family [Lachnobacterium bovis]
MDKINLPHHHNSSEEEEKIISNLPNNDTIESVSEALKHLGDPTRLKIFWILCHTEECVLNIATMMSMTSPAVSHHLRILKAAGLLITHRNGKEMYYTVANTPLAQKLHHTVEDLAEIQCIK